MVQVTFNPGQWNKIFLKNGDEKRESCGSMWSGGEIKKREFIPGCETMRVNAENGKNGMV